MPFGILPIAQNECPLARDRVRYCGDPVVAVAAVDKAAAERALGLIRLRVHELPTYLNARSARAPGAVDLHANRPGNVERDVYHQFGDVDAGFAAADTVGVHVTAGLDPGLHFQQLAALGFRLDAGLHQQGRQIATLR